MSQDHRSYAPVAHETHPLARRSLSPHTPFSQHGCLRVHTTVELSQMIEPVVVAMAEQGYSDKDMFGMRVALEEALVNAIKHGHQGDSSLIVRVHYKVTQEQTLATVEDQGSGFDPGGVADPLAPENQERPCGRGLLLMRHYLSWLRFNKRGNAVTLCCRRSAD